MAGGRRGDPSRRADDINVRTSQPDFFDYHSCIENFFAMLPGIELSLQMLGNLKVFIDSALDLSAPSLTPFFSSPDSGLARRASPDKNCGAGANQNTEKRQSTAQNNNANVGAHAALLLSAYPQVLPVTGDEVGERVDISLP
jgi:hypothetical protein